MASKDAGLSPVSFYDNPEYKTSLPAFQGRTITMSSQSRVDPFEIRPESGLGGRWPMRWRPGTSVEGGTRFWPSGFRVYPILAIAIYCMLINRNKKNGGGYVLNQAPISALCFHLANRCSFSIFEDTVAVAKRATAHR